jgi:hypothetical protein
MGERAQAAYEGRGGQRRRGRWGGLGVALLAGVLPAGVATVAVASPASAATLARTATRLPAGTTCGPIEPGGSRHHGTPAQCQATTSTTPTSTTPTSTTPTSTTQTSATTAKATTSSVAAVGGFVSSAGSGVSTLQVDPHAKGDALVAVVKVGSSSVTVASVSGGGASWTRVETFEDGGHGEDLWLGTVTTPGVSTVTVGFSASVAGIDIDLGAQEFSSSLGTGAYWSKDRAAGQDNASSTTVAFPTLSPAGQGELYFGYARGPGSLSAGTTPGVTYTTTADGNLVAYDPAVSATLSPTGQTSSANPSASVGALITATGTAPPAPSVTTLSPTSGPTAGGTTVTITGTNLSGATKVSFGTAAATTVNVTSPTSLSATSPAGSGTVDVTVTTAGGTSPTTSADRFTYTGTPTPSIAAVGGLADVVYPSGGTALPVNPVATGDALVVTVDSHAPFALSGLSGGGVTTWVRAVQFVSARGHDIELWYGTVTRPGSSQITVTWPAPGVPGYWTEYTAQEFSASFGSNTIWSVDNGQAKSFNGPLVTTLQFPTLTPQSAGDLYYGLAGFPGAPAPGSTPGFTYDIDAGGNVICYDTNVTSSVSPTASQSPANLSEIVGALLRASSGT